jgi:hypothetical protein
VRLADERFLELARDRTHVSPFGAIGEGCDLGEERDVMAQAIHADYCREHGTEQPWDQLDEGIRDSNRQQADHIPVKLRAVSCECVPEADAPGGARFTFTDSEVELLARMEHARWCAERFIAGWRPGPERDRRRKLSPALVPFDALEATMQENDRNAVRAIPRLLSEQLGLAIRRKAV